MTGSLEQDKSLTDDYKGSEIFKVGEQILSKGSVEVHNLYAFPHLTYLDWTF